MVYIGNFLGAIGTAAIVIAGGWYKLGNDSVGAGLLSTASGKVGHTFLEAFALGIMCNALVCLAVWLTYSARTTTDRIMAIVPPVVVLAPVPKRTVTVLVAALYSPVSSPAASVRA